MVGIGIIGYGYWGPNLVRNFAETPGVRVAAVSDLRADRLAAVSARYPGVATTTSVQELIDNPAVDAVAIATPVFTHFDLAMKALKAGKHVLVEKPLASSLEQATQLIEEAEKRGLVLMVDHTFVYTGAVRKIRQMVQGGELGDIYYYDSMRVNLGLFQHDIDVLWDLAVHDLSIMDYVLPERPCAVSATGISHVAGRPENIAYLTLFFESSLIAHINVNWLAPVKVRQTLIGGSQRMIVYDDLEPSEKIKIYDKGITIDNSANNDDNTYNILLGYRTGDMWAPKLDGSEALRVEADHFVDCINNGTVPITGGERGMQIVQILEAATKSMAERGKLVELGSQKVVA